MIIDEKEGTYPATDREPPSQLKTASASLLSRARQAILSALGFQTTEVTSEQWSDVSQRCEAACHTGKELCSKLHEMTRGIIHDTRHADTHFRERIKGDTDLHSKWKRWWSSYHEAPPWDEVSALSARRAEGDRSVSEEALNNACMASHLYDTVAALVTKFGFNTAGFNEHIERLSHGAPRSAWLSSASGDDFVAEKSAYGAEYDGDAGRGNSGKEQ